MALLTRLDSVIVVAVAYVFVIRAFYPNRMSVCRVFLPIAAPLLIVAAWLFWKKAYYGDLLPNPYYVEMTPDIHWVRGLRYLRSFANATFLFPVGIAAIWSVRRMARASLPGIGLAAVVLATWCAYVIRLGGDWMSLRLVASVLPDLFLLVAWLSGDVMRPRIVSAALIGVLLAAPVYDSLVKPRRGEPAVSIPEIRDLGGTDRIGQALHRAFPGGGVRIATTAAGAMPYFARLPAVDMHGLNDSWLARHGRYGPEQEPGHERGAPFGYLVRRRVNLVIIDVPMFRPGEISSRSYTLADLGIDGRPDAPPPNAKAIEIPIDDREAVLALYLTRNPLVEAKGWRTAPLSRR